jgi:hypothetical protein
LPRLRQFFRQTPAHFSGTQGCARNRLTGLPSESVGNGPNGLPELRTVFVAELNRAGAINHPLVNLFLIEPPVRANPEGWDLAPPKQLVDGARMHPEIISQLFRRHNDN